MLDGMKRFAAILCVLTGVTVRALAWSAPGRMVIAAEAYGQLSPALQSRVTEILKAHPDYAKWEASYGRMKFAGTAVQRINTITRTGIILIIPSSRRRSQWSRGRRQTMMFCMASRSEKSF